MSICSRKILFSILNPSKKVKNSVKYYKWNKIYTITEKLLEFRTISIHSTKLFPHKGPIFVEMCEGFLNLVHIHSFIMSIAGYINGTIRCNISPGFEMFVMC